MALSSSCPQLLYLPRTFPILLHPSVLGVRVHVCVRVHTWVHMCLFSSHLGPCLCRGRWGWGPAVRGSATDSGLGSSLDPETMCTHPGWCYQCPGCKQPVPGKRVIFLMPISHPVLLPSLILCYYTSIIILQTGPCNSQFPLASPQDA